jgi:prolycopene isomerase
MLIDFLFNGAHCPRGGAQRLADAYVTGLEANGGELLLRAAVRRILVDNRRVTGVMLENGQRIRAPLVISNASAPQTFDELVGYQHLPRAYVRALQQMRPSLSAIMGYMATDLPLHEMDVDHDMFLYSDWDHDEVFRKMVAGEPTMVGITIPTLIDPSLAPPGEHLVITISEIPFDASDSWRQTKERYAAGLLDRVETVIPGLRDKVTFFEGASPRTFERYTLNDAGAIYGWERCPEQSGANTLSRRTPIKGLTLCGHWTQPGGGIINVVVSAMMNARDILGYKSISQLLKALEAPAA